MVIVTLIFAVLALISFIAAAFSVVQRVNLIAVGLALLVLGVWVIPGLVAFGGAH